MTDYREGTHREKKARKAHSCDECKQEISKGTEYIRLSIFHRGRYTSTARHKQCALVSKALRDRLMTDEGFPLTLAAGLRSRPAVWRNIKDRLKHKYPSTYLRLVNAGLPL